MNGNSYDFQELFNQNFFKKVNFINETKIFNELQNNKKILIFDFRPRTEFNQCHCENSINIPSDEIDIEDLLSFNENFLSNFTKKDSYKQSLLSKYKRLFIVIICSHQKIPRKHFLVHDKSNTNEELLIAKVLIFYRSLLNNKIREIGIFVKGFKLFEESYFFLTIQDANKPKLLSYPSDLFNHKVFIGNQKDAMNKHIINSLKITHIINATNHIPNIYENIGIKYLTIPVEDNDTNKISPYFKVAYDFIENALSEGTLENGDKDETDGLNENLCEALGRAPNQFVKAEIIQKSFKKKYFHTYNNNRILIHCSLGVSRSSTIAIMYIMKKFLICYEEACNFVRFQKEASCPINCFLYELETLEKNKCCFE